MSTNHNTQATKAIVGIYMLLISVVVFCGLYFGREIIIPITISILLTFLLAPIVSKLEKWIGRIPAILTVVLIIFIFGSIISYILSIEFIDLTKNLPSYKGNIEAKISSFHMPQDGILAKIGQKIQGYLPVISDKSSSSEVTSNITSNITRILQIVLGSLVHLLANIGLVLLLVIFMLLNREDLKGRIIRLMGQGRITKTTKAMEDAGTRISHYLFMQLIVNSSFGILLAVSLWFIGIPNAILWGGLLIVLRFIPYIGTWISALIPVALSFLISAGWMSPLLTIGVYLILDLICSHFLEPWLYGSSTGVSSTALIIAAVFWTLLWGPVGLLLAIPLTVCLVVIGRHVPQLEFLCILLGDDKPLGAHAEYYHHILIDSPDDLDLIDHYLNEKPLISLYDEVLIPSLINLEQDVRSGKIDSNKASLIFKNISETIEDLNPKLKSSDFSCNQMKAGDASESFSVLCLPVNAGSDEIAAEMLKLTLLQHNISAENLPFNDNRDNTREFIEKHQVSIVCITMLPPSTILQMRKVCKKILSFNLNLKIVLFLSGIDMSKIQENERRRTIEISAAATSLKEITVKIENFVADLN
jgi:predicted PurR-regulated permease PerM